VARRIEVRDREVHSRVQRAWSAQDGKGQPIFAETPRVGCYIDHPIKPAPIKNPWNVRPVNQTVTARALGDHQYVADLSEAAKAAGVSMRDITPA
jgi:hypothetical protein